MSAPEESLNGQDPDYVSTTSNDQAQRKIYEENARNTTAKKITAIVEKEFSREIASKEKEILRIQERLRKTLEIFHLLRYVIITNFYNREQCQRPQAAETAKQTRIHPAIKTLLGKCPKSTDRTDLAVPSTSTDPRFLYDESLASGASTTANNALKIEENANERDGALQGEKRKASDEEPQPRKIPRYVPPKSSVPEKACPSRGNSHRVRKRIVVGNISKWIPPAWREDASSHKWTMYVRGDKDENANIGTFVGKVRFFLHPSYRPNDVVEVTSYPFHLSRRGWGEFPLRVQLHFKNASNKPMDIIHHLKLDRTYTGLQTLGSETLVDVWIHTAESRNPERNNYRVESSVNNDALAKVEPNDGDSFEMSRRLTANTSEKMQRKEMSEARKRATSSLDLTGIKTEPNDADADADADATTHVSNDERGEAIRNPVEHDHNYCSRRCFDSGPCTVREGNVTVEHCPGNDCTTFAIASFESNEKNADLVVPSHRFNGDIQSSGNSRHASLASSNATTDASLVANTFQKNNGQKSLSSLDTVKSLRAKNSNSDDTFGISETISAKDTATTTNGFHKPSRASLACFDDLRKAASSSETSIDNTSHLRPLRISIPPSNIFASSTSKHVLLLKDKKSIPVDLASILPSKSNENSKKFVDGDAKVSVPRDGGVARLNVRVPQGVSILKKPPPNAKATARKEGTVDDNKKAVVLELKSANSLLLNVNENVPILKIADSRDLRNTYGLAEATTRSDPLIGEQRESVSRARSEKTVVAQRAKVTLGKDNVKIQSKKDLYEAVLRSIDTVNIADTEALIRFIVRRVPIVARDARDPEYRRLHPYACCSEEEYFACNVGKRRAMEWYRAKTIGSFLRTKPRPIDQLWSIKEIILWARLHGYTPSRNAFGARETAGTSDTKKLPDTTTSATVLSTCTEPRALHKWLQTCQREPNRRSKDNHIDDEEIDVENVKESPRSITIDRRKNDGDKNSARSTGSALLPIELDEDLLPFHNFVCDTARDIGIEITPEEIIPGVVYCAASRVMMRVVECFVEDLTRSSLARAWERNSGNECPKVITPNDVRNALANREEFDIFTNEGLGSRQDVNTTEL